MHPLPLPSKRTHAPQQDRATRRDANKPRAPRVRQGDEQDDDVGIASAGANPFKKARIVSKFDVNDIRKIEFVGSYEDNESAWPKVSVECACAR